MDNENCVALCQRVIVRDSRCGYFKVNFTSITTGMETEQLHVVNAFLSQKVPKVLLNNLSCPTLLRNITPPVLLNLFHTLKARKQAFVMNCSGATLCSFFIHLWLPQSQAKRPTPPRSTSSRSTPSRDSPARSTASSASSSTARERTKPMTSSTSGGDWGDSGGDGWGGDDWGALDEGRLSKSCNIV